MLKDFYYYFNPTRILPAATLNLNNFCNIWANTKILQDFFCRNWSGKNLMWSVSVNWFWCYHDNQFWQAGFFYKMGDPFLKIWRKITFHTKRLCFNVILVFLYCFFFFFFLVFVQSWWFPEVLGKSRNPRWPPFGNHDLINASYDVITSRCDLKRKDLWKYYMIKTYVKMLVCSLFF